MISRYSRRDMNPPSGFQDKGCTGKGDVKGLVLAPGRQPGQLFDKASPVAVKA